MPVWVQLLIKYLCVKFNSYLNKYLLLFIRFWVFLLEWRFGGTFEWFFIIFPLHYKNTFPTVLQELKFEWSHAPMDIFFRNWCEIKHKETLRKVRVHHESRIELALLILFQCCNSHPASILLCDTESKLTWKDVLVVSWFHCCSLVLCVLSPGALSQMGQSWGWNVWWAWFSILLES